MFRAWINWVVILTITFITIVRFFVKGKANLFTIEGVYEAHAHLFVGGLIGAALVLFLPSKDIERDKRLYVGSAIFLICVELFAFSLKRL